MTNRITRGFRRLGIGVAVLVALVGSGVTAKIAIEEYSSEWGWEITSLDGGAHSVGREPRSGNFVRL
jgi:hypothetical protein